MPLDCDSIKWQRVDVGLAAGRSGVPDDIPAIWADPFLFRTQGRTFVTFKEADGLICEAQNEELTVWKAIGHIDGVDGECPNLFPLNGRHVLIRSTYPLSCLVGDFDPDSVCFKHTGPHVMDHGYGNEKITYAHMARGLYGTTVFRDRWNRTVLLGWVSGFKTGRGWDGCMSLPRLLSLNNDGNLIQSPAPELQTLRDAFIRVEDIHLREETRRIDGIKGNTLEIIAEFRNEDASRFGITVRASDDGAHGVSLSWSGGVLDVHGTRVPVTIENGLQLHIFLDRSVLEVFVADGRSAVTRVFFVRDTDLYVNLFPKGGTAVLSRLDAWQMRIN